MHYAGIVIRNERIKRDWSQEGLCRGICAVSYLSKIEQGKAEPSLQVLELLMERLGICWTQEDPAMEQWILDTMEAMLSYERSYPDRVQKAERESYIFSSLGVDFLLLEQFAADRAQALPADYEPCMDQKQLALQRLLQGRYEEALGLYPVSFVYSAAGTQYYEAGQTVMALELLQTGYDLAAREGRPRVMLHCKAMIGNCYSNQRDIASMQAHYQVARRLALTLQDKEYLNAIEYNTAATAIDVGDYEQALSYFSALELPGKMDLHKLAICYEKLGQREEAFAALEKSKDAPESNWIPDGLEERMLELVRLRLEDPGYLKNQAYGKKLMDCFADCQKFLPVGYAEFHLCWVLEWLEENRQYKKALSLVKDFPKR